MEYKEQIEKEADEYADVEYNRRTDLIPMPTPYWYSNKEAYKGWYKFGYNEAFNSKIAERIKYEFAIEILESKPNWDMWTIAKLTELKNKIQ